MLSPGNPLNRSESKTPAREYKGIVGFDFDNTLADTDRQVQESGRDASEHYAQLHLFNKPLTSLVSKIFDKEDILPIVISQRDLFPDEEQKNPELQRFKERKDEMFEVLDRELGHNRSFLTKEHIKFIANETKSSDPGDEISKTRMLHAANTIPGCKHIPKDHIFLFDDDETFNTDDLKTEGYQFLLARPPKGHIKINEQKMAVYTDEFNCQDRLSYATLLILTIGKVRNTKSSAETISIILSDIDELYKELSPKEKKEADALKFLLSHYHQFKFAVELQIEAAENAKVAKQAAKLEKTDAALQNQNQKKDALKNAENEVLALEAFARISSTHFSSIFSIDSPTHLSYWHRWIVSQSINLNLLTETLEPVIAEGALTDEQYATVLAFTHFDIDAFTKIILRPIKEIFEKDEKIATIFPPFLEEKQTLSSIVDRVLENATDDGISEGEMLVGTIRYKKEDLVITNFLTSVRSKKEAGQLLTPEEEWTASALQLRSQLQNIKILLNAFKQQKSKLYFCDKVPGALFQLLQSLSLAENSLKEERKARMAYIASAKKGKEQPTPLTIIADLQSVIDFKNLLSKNINALAINPLAKSPIYRLTNLRADQSINDFCQYIKTGKESEALYLATLYREVCKSDLTQEKLTALQKEFRLFDQRRNSSLIPKTAPKQCQQEYKHTLSTKILNRSTSPHVRETAANQFHFAGRNRDKTKNVNYSQIKNDLAKNYKLNNKKMTGNTESELYTYFEQQFGREAAARVWREWDPQTFNFLINSFNTSQDTDREVTNHALQFSTENCKAEIDIYKQGDKIYQRVYVKNLFLVDGMEPNHPVGFLNKPIELIFELTETGYQFIEGGTNSQLFFDVLMGKPIGKSYEWFKQYQEEMTWDEKALEKHIFDFAKQKSQEIHVLLPAESKQIIHSLEEKHPNLKTISQKTNQISEIYCTRALLKLESMLSTEPNQRITGEYKKTLTVLSDLKDYEQISKLTESINKSIEALNNVEQKPTLDDVYRNAAVDSCQCALNALQTTMHQPISQDSDEQTRALIKKVGIDSDVCKTFQDTLDDLNKDTSEKNQNTTAISHLTDGVLLAAKALKNPSDADFNEMIEVADRMPGHSSSLKKAAGALMIFGGFVAIGVSLALVPFTGGTSALVGIGITAALVPYIAGTAAAIGVGAFLAGDILMSSGTQKSSSKAFNKFASFFKPKQTDSPSSVNSEKTSNSSLIIRN